MDGIIQQAWIQMPLTVSPSALQIAPLCWADLKVIQADNLRKLSKQAAQADATTFAKVCHKASNMVFITLMQCWEADCFHTKLTTGDFLVFLQSRTPYLIAEVKALHLWDEQAAFVNALAKLAGVRAFWEGILKNTHESKYHNHPKKLFSRRPIIIGNQKIKVKPHILAPTHANGEEHAVLDRV
jgi:hypothetical protein